MAIASYKANYQKADLGLFRHRAAAESDCSTLIKTDTVVTVADRIVAVYFASVADQEIAGIETAIRHIRYEKSSRTGGLATTSRIFGYSPANRRRNLACRAVSLARDAPKEHSQICLGANLVDRYYARVNPALHDEHGRMLQARMKADWVLGETVFTSGIVNHNNPLKYHFDTGNVPDVWSAMLVFKHRVTGGRLCVPELDLKFECGNRSLFFFDGQGLLHGVTPITRESTASYRYSIVYYSLAQMWNCLTPREELAKVRQSRTRTERRPKFATG